MKKKSINSLPYCAWSFFTRKIFSVFVWVLVKKLPNIFGTQARGVSGEMKTFRWCCWKQLGGRKTGSWRLSPKTSRRRRKITLLEALGLGLFPWRLLGLFSWLEKLWALFPWFFGPRWALHSRNVFAARRFLDSIKPQLWHFPEKRKVRPCQSWAPQQGTLP